MQSENIKEIAINKKYFLLIEFLVAVFKKEIVPCVRICKRSCSTNDFRNFSLHGYCQSRRSFCLMYFSAFFIYKIPNHTINFISIVIEAVIANLIFYKKKNQ